MAEAAAVKAEEATNGPDEPSVGATTEPDDGGGGGGGGAAVSIPAGLEHLSEDGTITFTKVNANEYADPPVLEAKDDWDEAELERLVGAYGAQIKRVVLKFDFDNRDVLTDASVEAVAKCCPNLEELVVE